MGVGTVTDDGYQFRPEREELRHTVAVDWDTTNAGPIEPVKSWATTTVKRVPATLFSTITGSNTVVTALEVDPVYGDIAAALDRRGQVILYGPPGTGKTYAARRAAVWLLDGGQKNAAAANVLGDKALMTQREQQLAGGGSNGRSSGGVDRLTRVTFHPSYAYEDFVEGFRPVSSAEGQGLQLSLVDGIFKRVCLAAAADPANPYVILIDEINRGNIPKIFGELITLLEKDKRGLTVQLPQSGTSFAVPANVWLIGTMNTADRSIHLLDSALRRRFGFIELLPDPEVLTGASVGPLALDTFLERLNQEIRQRVGREKQLGHALLFDGADIVDSPEAFTAMFRHEILPLLQEYLYEDYKELAELLGPVIDAESERPSSLVDEPEALCAALADHLDAVVDG
mgnify:CR=1 FL=1